MITWHAHLFAIGAEWKIESEENDKTEHLKFKKFSSV